MAQTWTYTTTYAGTGTVTGWFQTEETSITIPASSSTFRIKTPRVKVAATASRNDWTWGSTRKTKASVHPSWRTAGLWITSGYSGSVSMGAYSDWQTINDSSSFNTADYFNSSNPTERTISFGSWQGGVVDCVYDGSGTNSTLYIPCYNNNSSANMFTFATVYVQLDVPPTATISSPSYTMGGNPTNDIYAGLTTISVTVSDSAAYYGGSISSITLTVGEQSVTSSGDGTLSFLLNQGGVFIPTVTVTDTRGQTYTETFTPITVNVYTAPTISFDVARTLNDGTPDDEGTYGLIEAELTFTDVIATAVAPSVVLTDDDGTQTTPTVTWYTDNSLTTQVVWANVSSGDTVYGLFSGLSTQHSYQVSVRPRDSEGTGTAITQVIGAAFYTVDFLAGGHGIAFGKPASNVGFECAMDATFDNPVTFVDDADFGADVYIELPDYQTASTTDKAIYDAIVALGWDSDVLIP